jgi:ABC-type multidrug transport system fused ATPase/permease subunit
MKGRTTLVVAHRLSTIRRVDRVYVMVRGEIAEEGTHDDLLARGGEFTRIYNLQFAKDEEEISDIPLQQSSAT